MMEEQLQIKLPAAYKNVVTSFLWPMFAGGTEFSLWDDVALNVERTREYRQVTEVPHLGHQITFTSATTMTHVRMRCVVAMARL